MKYQEKFQEAMARTEAYGVPTPAIVLNNTRLLNQETCPLIADAVFSEVGLLGPDDLYGQCMSVHWRLRDVVSRVLNTQAIFTVGYVNIGGDDMFKNSDEELRALMQDGVSGMSARLHAWLTLPSMEILDFSLPTSLAIHNGWNTGHGQVVSEHADDLVVRGLTYHPQLVGTLSLVKMGALRLEAS